MAPGTAAKLIVDAAAFVPVGSDDVQSTQSRDAFGEPNVRPASGHGSGDSHCSQFACTSNNPGFFFLVSSIQDFVWYVFQGCAQPFGFLNAHRSNQNWLTSQMHAANFLNDGPLFLLLCSKENVWTVDADHRSVCRNDFDIQFVDGLFASGAIICIEFREFAFRRKRAEKLKKR